jgi:hypothetical protein
MAAMQHRGTLGEPATNESSETTIHKPAGNGDGLTTNAKYCAMKGNALNMPKVLSGT